MMAYGSSWVLYVSWQIKTTHESPGIGMIELYCRHVLPNSHATDAFDDDAVSIYHSHRSLWRRGMHHNNIASSSSSPCEDDFEATSVATSPLNVHVSNIAERRTTVRRDGRHILIDRCHRWFWLFMKVEIWLNVIFRVLVESKLRAFSDAGFSQVSVGSVWPYRVQRQTERNSRSSSARFVISVHVWVPFWMLLAGADVLVLAPTGLGKVSRRP